MSTVAPASDGTVRGFVPTSYVQLVVNGGVMTEYGVAMALLPPLATPVLVLPGLVVELPVPVLPVLVVELPVLVLPLLVVELPVPETPWLVVALGLEETLE